MIHVYKLGGGWVKDNINYTIRAINREDLETYLNDGWKESFEELLDEHDPIDKKELKQLDRIGLITFLEQRDIDYDGRWSDSKLRELVHQYGVKEDENMATDNQ